MLLNTTQLCHSVVLKPKKFASHSSFRNKNNLGTSVLSLPIAYTKKNAKECLATAFSTDFAYNSSLKVRMAPFYCVLGSCGLGTLGADTYIFPLEKWDLGD